MRHWINIVENHEKAAFINIAIGNGVIEGYVVNTIDPGLGNWLPYNNKFPNFESDMREKYKIISFISYIRVDDNERNKGTGNRLMEKFISKSIYNGAQAILLSVDNNEPQHDGFDLLKWYKRWGFKPLSSSPMPEMILDLAHYSQ